MQLYVADYLGDTRHLTTEQHGAYLLLLMSMWRADGRLPNDDKKLARITGCTPSRWGRIKADVLAFFDVEGDDLTHGRVMLELEKANEKAIQRAEAGRRGGRAKARKSLKADVANASDLSKHYPDIRSQSISPSEAKASSGESSPRSATPTISTDRPAEPSTGATFGPSEALATWNDLARRIGLPVAKALTEARRKAIRARLAEHGETGWRQALVAIERSAFLRGDNDRAFRADLDFLGQAKSFTRLLEGFYGNGAGHEAAADSTAWGDAQWRAAVGLWAETGAWSDALGPPPDQPETRVPPSLRPTPPKAA